MKIRNYAEYKEGDYKIVTYEDEFFGEWIGNEEIYIGTKMILHATLSDGALKQEDLKDRLHESLELLGIAAKCKGRTKTLIEGD